MIFPELDSNKMPKHVAIIMDGNRRWAMKKSVSVFQGHKAGLERLIEILEVCQEIGIEILSLYAFSIENWKRSSKEIKDLLNLFRFFYHRDFKKLKKKNIKILYSGNTDPFSKDIKKIIKKMVLETKNNNSGILNLAINYSGRLEIIEAIKKLIKEVYKFNLSIENLNEKKFEEFLFHPNIQPPDLLIRTSGELRVSNFLLWQIAYTELYFTDTLWPSFSRKDFIKAIVNYQKRERRFGGKL